HEVAGAGRVVLVPHDFALAFQHGPQIAAALALAEHDFAGSELLGSGDLAQLAALLLVQAAEEGNLFQQFVVRNVRAHVMPPKIVARPTRPMPNIYAAVRRLTLRSACSVQTCSKLADNTRSSSCRTRFKSH